MSEELKAELAQAAEAVAAPVVETVTQPEAASEQVTAVALGETAIGTVPDSVHVHYSEPAPRWDKDKAETIAAVMQQQDEPGKTWLGKPDNILNDVVRAKEISKDVVVTNAGDYEAELFETSLNPYVEFYQLNPEKFATMPTAEFMNMAEQFDDLLHEIKSQKAAVESLEAKKQAILDTLKKPNVEPVTVVEAEPTPEVTTVPEVNAVIEPADSPSL